MNDSLWLVIGILAFVVVLVIAVRIRTAPKAGEERPVPVAEPSAAPAAPARPAAPAPVVQAGIPAATVAAIMAAIEAASNGASLRFVAIRRADANRSLWRSSGTNDIISNRQQYL